MLNRKLYINHALFAVVGLSVPAVFTYTNSISEETFTLKYQSFSLIVSAILLIVYVIGLIYSFKTQKDLYGVEHAEDRFKMEFIS